MDMYSACSATAMVSVRGEPPPRMAMRLHMVPGSSRGDGAAAAGSLRGAICMDSAVWRNLPDDMVWKVLEMVPGATRFQLHLVSRHWRRVLTSAEFCKAVAARERSGAAARDAAASALPVAYVVHGSGSVVVAGTGAAGKMPWHVDIDLSFVPRGFWRWGWSDGEHYSVVAAGDGLVCVVDARVQDGLLRGAAQLCVLNPATRTCQVVPRPPVWAWTTQVVVRVHAGAVTVLADGLFPERGVRSWALAWCDLEEAAAGRGGRRWTVAHGPEFQQPPARLGYAVPAYCRVLHVVTCGGEWYCYHEGKVYVHAVAIPAAAAAGDDGAAAPGRLVVTAEVATPIPRDASAAGFCDPSDVALVAHGGRVFLVALVDRNVNLPGQQQHVASVQTKSCRVWVLARERMEWRKVGEPLYRPGLNRLRGFQYASYSVMTLCGAYACGDLVCLDVLLVHDPHGFIRRVRFTVGLNLVTRAWELVHDAASLIRDRSSLLTDDDRLQLAHAFHAFQFRPNLFLS